jgi:Flp pilus assembly protein TadG
MVKSLEHSSEREEGSAILELALVLPLLLLLLAGAVDLGRAYFAAIEVQSAAQAGALYGSQYPTDTAGMVNAAMQNAQDITSILQTPSATYGCECYDGTPIACGDTSDSCPNTGNLVYYVTVTTAANYKPLLPWPGIPSSIVLTGKATMRAAY